VGEGGREEISSYANWKAGALKGFAKDDATVQALIQDKEARQRKATG